MALWDLVFSLSMDGICTTYGCVVVNSLVLPHVLRFWFDVCKGMLLALNLYWSKYLL